MNLSLLYDIVLIFAGLGVLLYGIKILNLSVQSSLGFKFKKALGKFSKNPYKSFLLGTGTSFLVQSASFTNVMATGLLNVGSIGLGQTMALCLGACFGASLAMIILMFQSISLLKILSLLIFVGGVLYIVAKSQKLENISKIFLGFGMFCLGISLISDSVAQILSSTNLTAFFTSINVPILLILFGLLLTTIMQSTYPVVAILIVLLSQGLLSFDACCYAVLGANIGSMLSVSIIIAGFSEGTNGRRVFCFNLFTKIIVCIVFALLMFIPDWNNFIYNTICFGKESVALVVMVIIYNLFPIVLLQFLDKLSSLYKVTIKQGASKDSALACFDIDDVALTTPIAALNTLKTNTAKILTMETENLNKITQQIENDEKYVSQKSKIKILEKSIRLTTNNAIRIGGKFDDKLLEKMDILITILNDISYILKINIHLDEFAKTYSESSRKFSKKHIKILNTLGMDVQQVGNMLEDLFKQNLPKSEIKKRINVIFQTHDINLVNINKAKKHILVKDDGKIDYAYYFSALYEIGKLENEYIDIAIKLILLEE